MATGSNDLEYYSKVNQLQEFLKERSLDRAARLQVYWKKLCENEKTSQARNQRLLKEFDRVEAHVSSLSVRTERLRLLQEKYKRQVDQMYPNWRQRYIEQLIRQRKKPHQNKDTLLQESHLRNNGHSFESGRQQAQYQHYPHRDELVLSHGGQPPPFIPPTKGETPLSSHGQEQAAKTFYQMDAGMDKREQPPRDVPRAPSNRFVVTDALERPTQEYSTKTWNGYQLEVNTGIDRKESIPGSIPQETPQAITERYHDTEEMERPTQDASVETQGGGQFEMVANIDRTEFAAERLLQESPQGTSGRLLDTDQAGSQTQETYGSAENGHLPMDPIKPGVVAHRQIFGGSPSLGRTNSEQVGDVSSRTDPFTSSSDEEDSQRAVVERPEQGDLPAHSDARNTAECDDFLGGRKVQKRMNEEVDQLLDDEKSKTEYSDEDKPTKNVPAADGSMKEEVHATKEEDAASEDSDIESDLSLPLSEENRQSSPEQEPTVPLTAELTTNGYLHLLQRLEYVIDRNEGQADIYDDTTCSQEMKTSITKDANSKLPLDTYDALNLSRVVLQELPLLVHASPRGYLISDQVLKSERPILEVTIRSAITTNALPFWDRTLKHMVFLVRRGYYEPGEIAERVAPLMLSKDSSMRVKAVTVVTNLLEDAVEEPTLEESSLTQTSIDETPSAPRLGSKAEGGPVPPLKLDMSAEIEGSSEDEDSFFDQDVPLKETDAYKQMLQSVQPKSDRQSEVKTTVNKDAESLLAELEESSSDDGNDDVEAILSPPASGRSSNDKPKKMVLSSLGGMLDQVDAVPATNNKGDAGQEQERTGDVSSPDKSDVISSASEATQDGGGYVPSAMDNSLKSSGRKSNAMHRSSSFWGEESDLDESEMSVPMGTGEVDDDKDDFDFYD